MRSRLRLSRFLAALVSLVTVAGVLLIAVSLVAGGDAAAHSGHTQKKLFSGRWFDPGVNLRTSQLNNPNTLVCDNDNFSSCSPKWIGPIQNAVNDWNGQPDTADFVVQGDFNINYDINIVVVDEIIQPGILGLAQFYNSSGNSCNPNLCTYYYGEAYMADDGHTGAYGTTQSKQATVVHELGHLLSLRHESVNADESVLYQCGQDDTGAIPLSIMSYDCVDPPSVGGSGLFTVQPFDVCGVNHAYPDAAFGFQGCVCLPPPSGAAPPPGSPAYFHPVTPARILDTRFGPGPTGKVGEGCVISVQVAGVGGLPASGVSAVVLNTTVTGPSAGSYLTLYPSGSSLPLASNLNFSGGQTVPNLVTVKVGSDGKINVYNNKGTTHVVLDVAGWYDSTPDVGPDVIGIDVGTSGNTATSVGTIEHCAQTIARVPP